MAGILVSDPVKEYGVILHQRYADAIGRERFSIAHELGHFLLQHHAPISYCFDYLTPASNVREQEKEADKFATLLLMPERLISFYLDNAEFCFKTLNQLSRRAEVSVSALINRCCELSQSQTLIAVYSKRGICSYTWTNWSLLRGHRLKKMKKKLFHFVLLSEGSITEKEKVPIDKWFDNVMGEPFILFEQTYFQSNGYAITLLTMQHH